MGIEKRGLDWPVVVAVEDEGVWFCGWILANLTAFGAYLQHSHYGHTSA